MQFQIIQFEDVPHDVWDSWVETIPDTTHLHSAAFIGFVHARAESHENHTFALLSPHGEPIALCPLGLSQVEIGGSVFKDSTWSGFVAPGAPAIKHDTPTRRRRLAREVYDFLHTRAISLGIQRMYLRVYPMSTGVLQNDFHPIGQMELLSQGYACQPQNNLIIDLNFSVEDLRSDMTKYQRRHIRKAERLGLRVMQFRSPSDELDELFRQYQIAHEVSAGRTTRPQKSFDYMLGLIRQDKATLFVVFVEEIPISFLYCGQFQNSAYGWSQANREEYEAEYSPRHLLEWTAMIAYKQRGFQYYGLGNRLYGPQLYKIPSAKELSIATFKERYGGYLWADLWLERFFDRDLFEIVNRHRLAEFAKSDYFFSSIQEHYRDEE